MDIFCLGLTLLEILASSESEMSRCTLKCIIRMMNQGQKPALLGTLLHEPMRDFMAKALEEDPEKRYGCQQLLEHPFITQVSKSAMKLSEGLLALITEQAAQIKHQRAQHQQSKIIQQSSLHLSTLNGSAVVEKSLAVSTSHLEPQRAVGKAQPQNQPDDKQEHLEGEERKRQETGSSGAQTAKSAILEGTTGQSHSQKHVLQASGGTTRGQRATSPSRSNSSRTKQPPEVAIVEPNCSPWAEPRRRSSSRYRGKTISYLELPECRQKLPLISNTPKKPKQARQHAGATVHPPAKLGAGVQPR